MLANVTKNADLWAAVWRRAVVAEDYLERVAAVPGDWHLLVLSEEWCGDAVNTVPVVAKLAAFSPNLELRVLARDENLDLMDAHLTGTSRSIPIVILLDDEYRERAWWGPRPTALQVLLPYDDTTPDSGPEVGVLRDVRQHVLEVGSCAKASSQTGHA